MGILEGSEIGLMGFYITLIVCLGLLSCKYLLGLQAALNLHCATLLPVGTHCTAFQPFGEMFSPTTLSKLRKLSFFFFAAATLPKRPHLVRHLQTLSGHLNLNGDKLGG